MKNKITVGILYFFVLIAPNVYSDDNFYNPDNIVLYYKGAPEVNTGIPVPILQVFRNWCGLTCLPTTTFDVSNPVTEKNVGKVRIWINDGAFSSDANTLCFTEFIEYTLPDGILYTLSRPIGHCGAFLDTLFGPLRNVIDAEIWVGGGGGKIVGGTRRYANAIGTYNVQMSIEFLNRTSFVYYDRIFFNLRPE